jgi:hypothetical protein
MCAFENTFRAACRFDNSRDFEVARNAFPTSASEEQMWRRMCIVTMFSGDPTPGIRIRVKSQDAHARQPSLAGCLNFNQCALGYRLFRPICQSTRPRSVSVYRFLRQRRLRDTFRAETWRKTGSARRRTSRYTGEEAHVNADALDDSGREWFRSRMRLLILRCCATKAGESHSPPRAALAASNVRNPGASEDHADRSVQSSSAI